MIRREREARDEDKLLELQKQFTSGQVSPAAAVVRRVPKDPPTSTAASSSTPEQEPIHSKGRLKIFQGVASQKDEEEPPQEAGVGDGATNETGPEAEEPPARTVGKVLERPTVAALPPSAPTVGKLSFPAPMHRSMAPWRQRKPPAPTPGTRDKKPRTSVIPPCDLRDAAAAPASSTAASRSSTSAALAGAGAASLDPGVAASKAMQDKEQEAVRAEVDRRLANMSLGEIEDAQSELASRFSADKIAMLRKRGATKRYGAAAAGGLPAAAGTSQPEVSEEPPLAAAALQDTGLCKSALPPPMLPKGEAQRRRGASETRFDMDGQLVSAAGDEALQAVEVNMRDPVRFGGEHVAKGYTLIEMAELVRSSIPQQRMAALRMLSAALARIRQGVRDAPERWALIWVYALREAQLPLVLRHALDDRHDTVISAAATAMSALILPAQVEPMIEALQLPPGSGSPSILPLAAAYREAGKAAWEKASDGNTDPVVTLLGAELLPRVRYLLEVAAIPGSVEPLVEVLVRCARQDQASATKMADCPRLLDMLYTEFVEELTAAEDSTLAGGSAAQRRSPEMRREYRSAAARALLVLRLVAELGGRRCADAVSRTGAVRAAASLVAAYASTGWETGASVPTEALRLWASAAAAGCVVPAFDDFFAPFCRNLPVPSTRPAAGAEPAGEVSAERWAETQETYRLLSALALPLPTASGGPSDRMAALGVRCAGAIMEMALTWLSTELVDHMTSLADGARQAAVCGALAAVLHFLTALCPRIGPPGVSVIQKHLLQSGLFPCQAQPAPAATSSCAWLSWLQQKACRSPSDEPAPGEGGLPLTGSALSCLTGCLQLLNAAAGATAEDEHCIAALQMAGDQLGKQVSRSLGSALVEDALDAEGGWGMVGAGWGASAASWVRPLELDFPWVHFQRLRLRAVGAALQGAMRHWSGEEGAAGSKTDMLSMAEALDICQAVVATASPGDEHVAGSAVLWTMLLPQMLQCIVKHADTAVRTINPRAAAAVGLLCAGDQQPGAMGACLPSDEEGATALGHALWENFALRLGLAASPGSGVVIGSRLPAPPGWALQALHGAGGNARLQGVRHPAWKRVAGGLALMAALRHCGSRLAAQQSFAERHRAITEVFLDDDVDLAQHPSVRPLLVHLHLSLCHASASAAVTDGAATVAPSVPGGEAGWSHMPAQRVQDVIVRFAATSYGDELFSHVLASLLSPGTPLDLRLALWRALADEAVLHLLPPPRVLAATGMLAVLRETGRSSWSELHEAYMDSLTTGSLDRSLSDGSIAAELAVRAVADFLFQDSTSSEAPTAEPVSSKSTPAELKR
ncbi:hypothetical protein CYMTET_18822 [Cymbomonas tetramitiformis]|uniref:RNA polymerase II-associated protein 1 N-terminal domain-containing protein n=1 Tax=Cymbomonas tetramitiformis TaxID=36881 RepID=A0AAE0L5I0_9CHLO|nr:hypothetical protein CYMTET_18822 [Cymbomonas tetramitiformis]